MNTMTAPPRGVTGLELVVERGAAGCALVALRGELDLFSGPPLFDSLDELIASGCTIITLDLSELTFLDSAGHRSLRSVADLAEGLGGELRLAGCSRPVRRFLDLTRGILASPPRSRAPDSAHVNLATGRPPRSVGF